MDPARPLPSSSPSWLQGGEGGAIVALATDSGPPRAGLGFRPAGRAAGPPAPQRSRGRLGRAHDRRRGRSRAPWTSWRSSGGSGLPAGLVARAASPGGTVSRTRSSASPEYSRRVSRRARGERRRSGRGARWTVVASVRRRLAAGSSWRAQARDGVLGELARSRARPRRRAESALTPSASGPRGPGRHLAPLGLSWRSAPLAGGESPSSSSGCAAARGGGGLQRVTVDGLTLGDINSYEPGENCAEDEGAANRVAGLHQGHGVAGSTT